MVVRNLPETSALVRTIREAEPPLWTRQDQLLAALVDQVRVLVWQNTKDGHKGRNQPQPIPRPGVEQVKHGGEAISLDEMADWLGWERQMTGGTE